MDDSRSGIKDYTSRLSLPAEKFDALTYCASTPEALGEFLEKLPHTNAAELCNRLYRLIPQVAGLNLPPGRKLNLLDLIKPDALDCVQRLTTNLAITPKSAKLLSLAIAMLKYLAEGYKSVLTSVLFNSAAPPQVLVEACHSTLSVLRQILMDCWECYVPPPPNIWKELHAVYQIACFEGIERTSISRRSPGQPQENSIRSSYVIPLMLSCADPGKYTHQDIRQIEFFLQTSAHMVDLDGTQSNGIFVIDPNSDKGPQYSFKAREVSADQFRLKTYRLVRNIEENLATGSLSGINERLAKELCKYWSNEIHRKEDTEPDNTAVSITVGLSHIHRHTTATRNLNEYLGKIRHTATSMLSLLDIENDSRIGHKDTFLKRNRLDDIFETQHAHLEATDVPRPAAKTLRQYPAIRTNVSNSGARIEFNAPEETLTAGEVIFIEGTDEHETLLGIVRWTKVTRTLSRTLGVELLATSFVSCAVSRQTRSNSEEEQFFPGLLYNHNDQSFIILPTMPFKAYTSVNVLAEGLRKEIKLNECVDATFHISAYNIPNCF